VSNAFRGCPQISKVLVFGLFVMLTGCSAFGFLFERLPWLSAWQFSRMFDLSDKQEERVEEEAEHIKLWLRNEGLPALGADLAVLRSEWDKQQDSKVIFRLFDALESHTSTLLEVAAPRVSRLMLELDVHNLEHFQEYLADKKEDWFSSLATAEGKRERRIDRLERWFGDLNDEQVALVHQHIVLLEGEKAIREDNTDHWSTRVVQAVSSNDAQALERWVTTPSIWWSSAYIALRAENKKQIYTLLEALVPTLTKEQVVYASHELGEWIDDLSDVSQED